MLGEIRRLARAEGLAVHPLKARAWYLKGYQMAPDVLIDVGVENGTPWFYEAWPKAKLALVDPLEECRERAAKSVKGRDVTFHTVALGAAAGVATLQVPETSKGTGRALSSLLERTDALAKSFTSVTNREVPVVPLDDIAKGYSGRIGLKIDTEGFEGPVLEGARETLKRCEFVILEMSVTPRFNGIAAPSSLVAMLAAAGLELRDVLAIADGAGKRAKPRHMDMLFTRWMERAA